MTAGSPDRPPLPVAVVLPCFRVSRYVGDVVGRLVGRVAHVYVVDDACPERSGHLVQAAFPADRVTVLFHAANQGVGGATITGYRAALADGHTIVVKMDGDGQMDPDHLPMLIAPILRGEADYTKGNRFFDLSSLAEMPVPRLLGNAGLSFVNKLASGYWDIMDPTNGYTAIHRVALARLPLGRLHRRYFFESDMLFRLSTIRAVVRDVPMRAIYGGQVSSLGIGHALRDFPLRFAIRIVKRFFYLYILRDFNIASINTLLGLPLVGFGAAFGIWRWFFSAGRAEPATAGTVMLAALPVIVGVQLLLSALAFDVANRPQLPLQRLFAEPV